jgi:hypothetical protein
MTMKEAVTMVKQAGFDIIEKDIQFCFAMSKMSVINELTQSSNYRLSYLSIELYNKMVFVEFLEFLGRLGH